MMASQMTHAAKGGAKNDEAGSKVMLARRKGLWFVRARGAAWRYRKASWRIVGISGIGGFVMCKSIDEAEDGEIHDCVCVVVHVRSKRIS